MKITKGQVIRIGSQYSGRLPENLQNKFDALYSAHVADMASSESKWLSKPQFAFHLLCQKIKSLKSENAA